MPFFPSSSSGGGSGSSSDSPLYSGHNPFYMSDSACLPSDAIVAEWVADVGAEDSSTNPIDVDGNTLTKWVSLCGRYNFAPTSGSSIKLQEDSTGNRYLDLSVGSSALVSTSGAPDLFDGNIPRYTVILVYKLPSVTADTFLFHTRNSSGDSSLQLHIQSSYKLRGRLYNEALGNNTVGTLTGGEFYHTDGAITTSFISSTGDKQCFAAGDEDGRVRYYDFAPTPGGTNTIDEIYIGCQNNYGTLQKYSGAHLYQVFIADRHLYRAEMTICSVIRSYGKNLTKPRPLSYQTDSDAWTLNSSVSTHYSMRGTGNDFTTSGSFSNNGDGITGSDTGIIAGSGAHLIMSTPPTSLLGSNATDWTLGFLIETPASFSAYEQISGMRASGQEHWVLEISAAGIPYFEYWYNGGSSSITFSEALGVNTEMYLWIAADVSGTRLKIAINEMPWEQTSTIAAMTTPNSATSQPWYLFDTTGSATPFSGRIRAVRYADRRVLTAFERSAMGTEEHHHTSIVTAPPR